MTRILSIILLILVAVFAANAQASNIHFGVMSGFADSNVTYGVTAGVDRRIGKNLIVADVDGFHLCKHAGNGGCGYEYAARGTFAVYVSPTVALQAGFARSQYRVERYGKSSNQYLLGVRYTHSESLIAELNYRRDFTSPNRVHFIELRATKYAKHHVFLRATEALSVLRNSGHTITSSITLAAGVYF